MDIDREYARIVASVTDAEILGEILETREGLVQQIVLDALNHRLDHELISQASAEARDAYAWKIVDSMRERA